MGLNKDKSMRFKTMKFSCIYFISKMNKSGKCDFSLIFFNVNFKNLSKISDDFQNKRWMWCLWIVYRKLYNKDWKIRFSAMNWINRIIAAVYPSNSLNSPSNHKGVLKKWLNTTRSNTLQASVPIKMSKSPLSTLC